MSEGFKIFNMRMRARDHQFFKAVCQHRKTTMSKAIVGYIAYLRGKHPKNRTLLHETSKHECDLGSDGNLFKLPSVEQEPENSAGLPV